MVAHICELSEHPLHWPVILHRICEMFKKEKALQEDVPLLILETIREMGSIWKLYEFTRSQYARFPLDGKIIQIDSSLPIFQFFCASGRADQGERFKLDGLLDQAAANIRLPTHTGRKDEDWLRATDETQLRLTLTFELGVEAWIHRLVGGGFNAEDVNLLRSVVVAKPQVNLYPISDDERRCILSQTTESTPIRRVITEVDFVPLVQTPEERFVKPRLEKTAKSSSREDSLQLQSLKITDTESEKELEPPTPIIVPRKLKHVVAHLFGCSKPESKVTMADIVGLMECAGFEPNHLPSSEMHFTRITGEPRGSICIHSHHGESHFRKDQLEIWLGG